MNAVVTRRALLGATATASLAGIALPASPSAAEPGVLSANDARLLRLVQEYEALDQELSRRADACRHLTGDAAKAADAEFTTLAGGYTPLEDEMAATPADSLSGVLTKARLYQVKTARDTADIDQLISLADDVWRLFGSGATA